MKQELTDKQKRFCEEYIIDLNGRQAAIRAGYSKKTAEVQASRLLRNANVQAYLLEVRERLARKIEITQESVLRELARVGLSDIRKCFDEDGKLKPIHELDDDTAAAIAGIEVDEIVKLDKPQEAPVEVNEDGDLVTEVEQQVQKVVTRKIKRFDKIRALEAINKMMGWNAAEKVQHEVGESFLDLLKKTSVDQNSSNSGVEQQESQPKPKANKRKRGSGRKK